MLSLTNTLAQTVAVLHDIVEDTALSHDDLRAAGFPTTVLDAVHRLTRPSGTAYADYVVRLKSDPLARAVKLADLADNARLDRNVIDTEHFAADWRRIGKYLVTYKFLNEQIDESTYRRLMLDLEDPT
jgi:hypothetical protein